MDELVPGEFFTNPGPNPHAYSAELRARCPVHKMDYPRGAGAYLVVDYETVEKAFTDPRLSKNPDHAPAWYRKLLSENSPAMMNHMLMSDPPVHTRRRRVVGKALLRRKVESMGPSIQEDVHGLIDALPDSGEVDLLSRFAAPLPLLVICQLLGVPVEDRSRFREWALMLIQSPNQQGEAKLRLQEASGAVIEYFTRLIAERRTAPREDMLSELVRAADEDSAFSEQELLSSVLQLLTAGHTTTANLIGNGLVLLFRHPDQLSLLRERPNLVESAVEEVLRCEGPTDRASLRLAAEDVELGGVHIPKESFVHLSLSSAGHDPSAFPDPDRFDITRSPNRHLSFGHGVHFCIGAPLARLVGRIAFATLLSRLPTLELAVPADRLVWLADSSNSRGVTALPVRYDERLAR